MASILLLNPQVSIAQTRNFFTGKPPTFVKATVPHDTINWRLSWYYFTLNVPVDSEESLGQITITPGDNFSTIDFNIDETQALSISTSAEVLSSITGDQASEIFAEVAVGDLTDEQGQEIVDAVQDAPEEVRSSFEAEINVFDGAFDNYAPIGSEISVAERRVVVAVGAVLASAMPLPQSAKAESSNGRRVK